jgi:hypothetical protein
MHKDPGVEVECTESLSDKVFRVESTWSLKVLCIIPDVGETRKYGLLFRRRCAHGDTDAYSVLVELTCTV